MATYCKEHNFIYFASPGTGSTSIEYALLEQLETKFIKGEGYHFEYGNRHAQFLELLKYKENGTFLEDDILESIDFTSIKRITSVRNPFEYFFADWYRNRTKWLLELENPDSWVFKQPQKVKQIVKACRLEFSEWVVDQLGHIAEKGRVEHLNRQFTEHADLFIRMEHMEEDLKQVSEILNLGIELKSLSLNRTTGRGSRGEYWRYYNSAARELVGTIYRPTLEKFNYRF